jgi:hypothetical protein
MTAFAVRRDLSVADNGTKEASAASEKNRGHVHELRRDPG